MSPRQRIIALVLGIPVAFISLSLFESYLGHEYRARKARQSVFLNTYRPDEVLTPFESHGAIQFALGGQSRGSVVDVSEFDVTFVGRESDRSRLIAALRQDLETKLKQSGARVTGSGSRSNSFDIEYVAGRAAGRATAEVVPANPSPSPPCLEPGEVSLRVLVRIHEGWAQQRPS